MELSKAEIEQIEACVDAAFVRVHGWTYRDEPRPKSKGDPSTNGNGKGQLVPDFRKLLDDDE